MKNILPLLFLNFICFISNAQIKNDTVIFFNLSSIKYEKHESNDHFAYIKTRRKVHSYGFTIPCNCMPGGSIGFFGHDNFETGSVFDPIKAINKKQYSQLKFMPFNSLISFLEKYQYKRKVKLYFVEIKDKKYYVYNVAMQGSFGTE